MIESLNPKDYGKYIAQYLRVCRHHVGETLDSASCLSGVSKGTIYMYENNKRIPGVETLIKLCNSYGYTYSEFFGGLGEALDKKK